MVSCPSCNKQFDDSESVCPDDGTPLPRRTGTMIRPSGGPAPAGRVVAPTLTPVPPADPGNGGTLPTENLAQAHIDRMLADDAVPIVPGTMMGEYEVTAKLGEGGMGEVYAAVHPIIGKKVAVKVLSDAVAANKEVVRRFVSEARAVNQIGHPNIVDVFSFGQHVDGRHYFVMEHLEGVSLEDEVEERETLSPKEVVEILSQTLDALQAAHDSNIIHRDLKPDNIFLVKSRRGLKVKLLDFGIAKLNGDDSPRSRTQTGVALGTPDYMSPEQCRGSNVGPATDIYACGVILYRMFSGHFPFEGADSILDLFMQVTHQEAPLPSSHAPLPKAFESIIVRCLSKEPESRYPSATDLSEALSAALKNPGIMVGPETTASSEADAAEASEDKDEKEAAENKNEKEAAEDKDEKEADKDVSGVAPSISEEEVKAGTAVAAASGDAGKEFSKAEGAQRSKLVPAGIGLALLSLGVVAFLAIGGSSKDKGQEASAAAGKPTQVDPAKAVPVAKPPDAGAPVQAPASIDAAPPEPELPGKLTIKSNVRRAEMILNGVSQGQLKGKSHTLADLAPGVYQLELRAKGYKSLTAELTIVAGNTLTKSLVLKREPKGTSATGTKVEDPKDETKKDDPPPKDTDTPLEWKP